MTITVGTAGGLVTSITEALAARPDAVLKLAPSRAAPLVTDAVSTSRSKRGQVAPAMSEIMLAANGAKQRAAASYLRQATLPDAKYLAKTQQAQLRNYFCGPATVTEMLAQFGVKLSQTAAAKQLGTGASGTDWSNSGGYPVARVLDANEKETSYVAVGLPWTPDNADVTTYENDLVTDLNRGSGVPLAGNAYEVPGGPHLIGHPVGQEIMHWFDIRGYSQGGAVTAYEDSVHGAPSIAWNGSVPAYSTLPSATIVYILGARGYIW